MAVTPFMNLSLPTPTVTLGPAWATQLNDALALVDSHDHSDGKGTRIKTAGIQINADLAFNSFSALSLRSTRFDTQLSPLSGASNSQSIFTQNGDLYWTNGAGTVVQITAGGTIVASPGAVDTLEYQLATSNTVLTALDKVIIAVDSSAAPITITLPQASDPGLSAGRLFVIKDFTGNSETYPITIAAQGADNIDGELTIVLDSNHGAFYLASDGISTWFAV